MFNEETTTLVENFITAKEQGINIVFRNQKVSTTRWNGINLVKNEYNLYAFFKRVVERRGLPPEELINFSVKSLTFDDYLAVSGRYKVGSNTIYSLLQFLPFVLDKDDFLSDTERNNLEKMYLKIPKPESNFDDDNLQGNYLTRRDFVMLLQITMQTCQERTYLRYAIYIGLCCLDELRRGEALKVQVKDFELDDNNLLKNVGNGYGVLNFPKYKAKRKRGSYKPYGNAVVPMLRDLINKYLCSDFMKGYDKSTYLFRAYPASQVDPFFDNVPDHNNKREWAKWSLRITTRGETMMSKIFEKVKPFLESELVSKLSSHDLRRSGNDWVKKTPINLPAVTIEHVAKIHARHTIKGDVNDRHYTSKPTIQQYLMCIDNALNFPWDFAELEKWGKSREVLGAGPSNLESDDLYPPLEPLRKNLDKNIVYANESTSLFDMEYNVTPKQKQVAKLEKQKKEIEELLQDRKVKQKFQLQAKLKPN